MFVADPRSVSVALPVSVHYAHIPGLKGPTETITVAHQLHLLRFINTPR
jgi:hypothetical protein